jgi:hypothetical protein
LGETFNAEDKGSPALWLEVADPEFGAFLVQFANVKQRVAPKARR